MANDVTSLQGFPYGGGISKSCFEALRPAIDTRGEWSKKNPTQHPHRVREKERERERERERQIASSTRDTSVRIRKGRRKRHVQAYPYTQLASVHNRFGITLSIEISVRRGRCGCNLTPRWIIFRRKLLPKVSSASVSMNEHRHTCPLARCEFRMSKIWYTRACGQYPHRR